VEIWDRELCSDPDRDFILEGITNGFHIIDPNSELHEAFMANYKSAVGQDNFDIVNQQVCTEIEEGRYIKVTSKPTIVSALGAIPKETGGVRLIHDCSRPYGNAVNDLVEIDSFSFQTVDEALTLVTPHCYMAKIDLKNAYRSIPISDESKRVTGLIWPWEGRDTFFIDTRLPFGAKASPGIFHRITQSVVRMMARRGFHNIHVYLDDFLVVGTDHNDCLITMNTLLSLLRQLGFHINWSKVEGPSTKITFLGIYINSENMTIGIPETKITDIKHKINNFIGKRRASKKQLQSILGKLSWVARVVPAGRIYLRALIDGIKGLKHPSHKLILTDDIKADLLWWESAMVVLNNTLPIKDNRLVTSMVTDACPQGCGAAFEEDWFYNDWELDWPAARALHINHKEALAVVLATRRWAPRWRNKRVVVYTDSKSALGMLQRAKSTSKLVRDSLKELFFLSVAFNFQIIPVYLPGKDNTLADRISRIRDRHMAVELLSVLPQMTGGIIECGVLPMSKHMSLHTVQFLFSQGCPLLLGRIS
jgi:hypothetical protein